MLIYQIIYTKRGFSKWLMLKDFERNFDVRLKKKKYGQKYGISYKFSILINVTPTSIKISFLKNPTQSLIETTEKLFKEIFKDSNKVYIEKRFKNNQLLLEV